MKHINLTQMLQGCSKRNRMTVRASNPDGEPTVNRQSRLMSLSGKKAEKEQLSPSCLLSASFPLSFRSRYLRYAAVIFCVLAMSVGQMWGAVGTSASTTFTCGTTSTSGVAYAYTFNSNAANSDTIVFHAASIYSSSVTYAYYQTGAPATSNNDFAPLIYKAVTGGSQTSSKGIYSASASASPSELRVQSGKILWVKVTNCTSVLLSGKSGGSRTTNLDVYLASNTSTPITNGSKTIGNTANTVEVPGMSASNTYLIKISGSETSNCAVYELALVYPHASGGGCSAPTSPNISGTTAYTAGQNISLTASATGTSASTTYTWYKGATWDAASETTPVQAASTSGATFTKASCVTDDAGTYWCNISNGTGCEVQTSKTITVSAGGGGTTVTATWPMYSESSLSLVGTASNSSITPSNAVATFPSNIAWGAVATVTYTDYTGKMVKITENNTSNITGDNSSISYTTYVKYSLTVATGYTFKPTGFSARIGRQGTDNGCAKVVLKKGTTGIDSTTISKPARDNASTLVASTTYSKLISDADTYEAGDVIDLYVYLGGKMKGKSFVISDVSITGEYAEAVTPSCTAPSSVPISGDYAYLGGQTISLTATPTGHTGTPQYQWQKETSTDVWENITGATSATFTKSNCGYGDSGNYRCVVSTGATCSTTSPGYGVHVYSLSGGYVGEDWEQHDLTFQSGTTGMATVHLNAGSLYKFKITSNNGKWYGNGTADYNGDGNADDTDDGWYTLGNISEWTFNESGKNFRLYTGIEGDYTFTVDVENGMSGSVKVSVTYPTPTSHPAAGLAYLEKPSGWTNVYLYWYGDDSYRLTNWDGAPEITATTSICGTTYYYTPLGTSFGNVIFKGNDGNQWTSISTSGCSGKYLDQTTYESPAWASFTTYTISFAGNGNTGGSMSAITDICPNADQLLPANTFEKTGYTFNCWHADKATKVGGSAIAIGGDIAGGATLQEINNNITLTAQWSATSYTLSYDLAGGSVASPNPTSYTIESSAITLNNPTKTGYTFAGWTGTDLVSATTTVTIAAGSTGNRSYTATWTEIVPSSVSLKASTTITVGGTETLTATISPAVVADNTITWTSSDETVATVTSAGVVTGVKAGTATITATTVNDKTATCEVTVAAAVTYTVTYDAQGGTCKANDTGSSITLATPTKTDYTFQGWYTSGGELVSSPYNPTANITLHALWREDACAGGGGGSSTITIGDFETNKHDKSNGKPDDFAKYQYGYINPSAKTSANAVTITTSSGNSCYQNSGADFLIYYGNSIRIYANNTTTGGTPASFEDVTSVSLKIKNANSSSFSSFSIKVGETTVANAVALSAEYNSYKVYTVSGLSNLDGRITIINHGTGGTGKNFYIDDIAITTAGGGGECYYVTYNGNGADGGFTKDEASHPSGSNVTVKTNSFTKTGYTFTGWNTDPDGEDGTAYTASGTINSIAGNMTLYAQWIESGSTYDIMYHCNDATSGCPDNATGQVALPDPLATPTKTNYSFGGWYTNEALSSEAVAGATLDDDADLYAKWTQTITLKPGTQGSGADKTPTVVWQGTALNGFSAHTATGYTLQGYYTAGSGGVKVLNADGTFAAANVTDYITSSKWSRTGAAPTLFAQWVATEDCRTLKYVWKVTGNFCDDKSTATSAVSMISENDYFTLSGTGYKQESGKSLNLQNTQNNYFLLTAKTGYQIKSICFYGKVQDSSVDYTTDGSSWSALASTKTDEDKYYTFDDIDASAFGIKLTAATPSGIWIRNMVIEVCAAGGTTYNVTYDGNDETGGTAPTDASSPYAYGATVTVLGNTGSLAKTNYTFAGWTTNNNGTGSSYEAGSTFSITDNTTLYAKWTQSVTLDKNGGSTGGSATAVWNATGLTGITHATPVSGYKLTGYYTAATEGTKVLNSDGTFASSNVTDYITDGKWICVASTRTLYAQYEVAGSLTWVLDINTSASELGTNSKTSSFSQISTSNMSDAALAGSLTYEGSKKSALTGKISTPASYTAADSVYVTFQVASGYKFTPSSVKVKVQPVTTAKYAKLVLEDKNDHSIEYTTPSTIGAGSIGTVEITNGSGISFVGTVTLKIYCYGATDGYRLGTPIQIDGEVEARCATMPSFTQMNYTTTTFAPNADASGSPITIVGGENIDTYQWKYNTTNDRTSGTNCGTGPSLDPLTDVASGTTRYYWCEMTNDVCGITIKSPAVAITVVAAKSDATVSWTGTTASANYGGGGYTVTATVSTAGWDGTLTEDMLTAMDGVVLSNIAVTNDGKTISANFGVTEGANAEATNVAFYLNHPATTGYNAIDETYNTTTLETSCIGGGGGDGSSYDVRVRKNTTTILQGKSTVYGWDTPTKGFVTQSTGGSVTSTKSGYDDEPVFDSISKGNAKAYWVKSYVANVKKIRVYGQVGDDDLTATGVYHVGSFVAGGSSTAVAYSVIYEDEVDALKKGNHWFEITLDEAISTNDIIYFTVNKNFKIMGVRLTTVGAGGATLATALSAWSPAIDTRKEVYEDAASFIETVTKTGANANTMGAITYSSGDETIATVDNRTGRVTIANSITWGDAITYKDVTITASLAPSGCYQGKTATYTLRVKKLTCEEAAGSITASSEDVHVVIEGDEVKKCTEETVTLTLGGYEEGATSFQWYKDGVLQGDKTTASITTSEAGVWYAVSNKGCAVTSTNEITITNRSTSVHVTRLVKEWYIKNGRLTPDIALWQLGDDCSFVSVAASDGWDAGTDLTEEGIFYEQDGIVYMKGTEPKANTGTVQNYTLTLTVNDGCSNQTLDADGEKITIHHQQNTDKHVLAFIVSGTDKGDWTAGVTADQTTNVGLYNAIAANFDVLATNSRSTDDEQKLKEYYSQFDILCITDYPNTGDKGANKKSYVDALGALIDIRPILTMEAWVSKLANWKAKGLSGNPKNPTTRQYTMDLQCKDHEIFAGTDLTKVGEGDEAMYRVSMVDNTKEDYATLDATYGEGAHADKSGYEYASKPALQGFTFTEEMANDLLPIGLIDDGAGNPLQVGIERQRNMEARLMVLGINSYAMERLTVDGEQVVINALNYLMKKNAEDIADCSIYFTGGDADEDESTRNNWNVDSHWSNGTQPISTQKVRILAPCVIPSGVQVHVTDVLIVPDGPINHGADVADGSLKIEAGGALIVDGKVEETTAPNYFHPHGTSAENLVLNTSSSAQAALILDNEDGDTQATVELYSLGCKKDGHYQFQYYAVPMDYVSVSESFAGSDIYTYVWHEATGWERRGYYTDLYAFEGVGITTKLATPKTYTMKGALASTATKEITLTKDDDGYNLIGNSWTAPIQISQLEEDNGSLSNKTVYIYNAGNDTTAAGGYGTTAGQWTAIPFSAAGFELWSGLKVIPAMQAFELVPTSEETLTLDYEKVVRGDNQTLTEKLHAPRRVADHAGIELMRIRVADSQTRTDLHLFEGERFSDEFDNGWEAAYKDGDDGTTKLYADVALGRMAVVATDELEGTLLGFAPGKETEYTFTFGGEGMGYYLNDLKLKKSTPISEGETYSFTYEEGDTNRFYISRTPIDAPQTPTGVENTHGDAVKARKFIYNDKLYIMLNGRVYSAEGQIVK